MLLIDFIFNSFLFVCVKVESFNFWTNGFFMWSVLFLSVVMTDILSAYSEYIWKCSSLYLWGLCFEIDKVSGVLATVAFLQLW